MCAVESLLFDEVLRANAKGTRLNIIGKDFLVMSLSHRPKFAMSNEFPPVIGQNVLGNALIPITNNYYFF